LGRTRPAAKRKKAFGAMTSSNRAGGLIVFRKHPISNSPTD
jgi:hypothetical protein